MAGAIAIKRAKHSLLLNHLPQRGQHCGRRFFFHQLRIIDLTGGIVEDDDQIMPPLVTEPLVFAAVNVQQHASHWPTLSPPGWP